MKQICCILTEGLLDVIDSISPKQKRNATIEDILWEHPEIRAKAKSLGVSRVARPTQGRKPKNETKHSKTS